MKLTEDEWKKKLTPEQYRVLREKGTEAPYTGKLLENKETGEYTCAACGNVIFKSGAKYDSHEPGLGRLAKLFGRRGGHGRTDS